MFVFGEVAPNVLRYNLETACPSGSRCTSSNCAQEFCAHKEDSFDAQAARVQHEKRKEPSVPGVNVTVTVIIFSHATCNFRIYEP